ncbi:MAG: hypothetical protein Q9209_000341 [Squamulea sp. 1 TL-2023]
MASMSAPKLSANLRHLSWHTSRASMLASVHHLGGLIPRLPHGPQSRTNSRTFLLAQHYHISCRGPTTTFKALQSFRTFKATSRSQQRDVQDLDTTVASSKKSDNNRSGSSPDASETPAGRASPAVVANPVVTDWMTIREKMTLIENEIEWISKTLKDPGVEMTIEARKERKARITMLQADLQKHEARLAWWQDIYTKGPREPTTHSDIYEHIRVAKEALKNDSESMQPVWTAQERAAVGTGLDQQEARVRKNDKWYKKIAWGPSIIGTAILNIIFN